MNTTTKLILFCLVISYTLNAYFIFRVRELKNQPPHIETITNTVIKYQHDTITITQPKYITKKIKYYDTLTIKDTIKLPIPITQKTYSDTITTNNNATIQYQAKVSGYNPTLDNITLQATYPTITQTTTQYITQPKRFNIGLNLGVGYGLTTKQPDLFIGVGVTYTLK